MRKKLFFFFLPLALLLMGGCTPKDFFSAAGKVGQVVWDPSKPVGSQEEQPSKFTISLYASDTVNPNPYSAPVIEEENPNEVTLSFSADSQEDMRTQLEKALATMTENAPPAEKTLTWLECKNTNNPICEFVNFKYQDKYPQSLPPTSPVFNIPVFTHQEEADRCKEFLALGQYTEYDTRAEPLVVTTDPSPIRSVDAWASQDPAHLRTIATPVAFKVIQLKDDSLFLNADYDTLNADLKGTLGTTYITHDDYVLTPSQFKYINAIELDKKTRYVAVYADFYEMDGAVWKGVVELEPTGGRTYHLIAFFQSNQVSVQNEGIPRK